NVGRRVGEAREAAREEVAVEEHLAPVAVGLVERLFEHFLEPADPVGVHAGVAAGGVVEGSHGAAVLELAGETPALRARTDPETRRGALALPHLAAWRGRGRRVPPGAGVLETGARDDAAPVHGAR